jgi:hypothetical protein
MHRSKRSRALVIRASCVAAFVVAASSAFAQTSASHPFGLDPYKPSDAQLLRMYGAALIGQTPVDDLAQLDPYKPSDAELLRQAGGAIPLFYGYWNWPGPTLMAPPPSRSSINAPLTLAATRAAQRSPEEATSPAMTRTAAAPQNNDGIWIQFENRRWTTAGRAIPMRDGDFSLIGMYGDQPVYRNAALDDGMIYVLVRSRTLVPFQTNP